MCVCMWNEVWAWTMKVWINRNRRIKERNKVVSLVLKVVYDWDRSIDNEVQWHQVSNCQVLGQLMEVLGNAMKCVEGMNHGNSCWWLWRQVMGSCRDTYIYIYFLMMVEKWLGTTLDCCFLWQMARHSVRIGSVRSLIIENRARKLYQ